ncbi:MAG: PhzF family phenazine biosynthesis protein [Chitinophagaceae bacterium]
MVLKIYQVDAFAEKIFEGNPAAVIPLSNWMEDGLMQQIAMENNLSETAFFVKGGPLNPPVGDFADIQPLLNEDATNNTVTSQSEVSEQITSPSGRTGGAVYDFRNINTGA